MSTIEFSLKLVVRVEKEGEGYVSYSPALDIASQGATEAAAVHNLVEAVQLFIESCYERGVMERVLKECGFVAHRGAHIPADERTVDVPLPLVAHRNAEAHAY